MVIQVLNLYRLKPLRNYCVPNWDSFKSERKKERKERTHLDLPPGGIDVDGEATANPEGLVGLDLLAGAADDGEGGGAAAEGRQALGPGRRHQS